MGEDINAYVIVVRKPEEMKPLGSPRHRCGRIILRWILER
jgi:hypothetical protein